MKRIFAALLALLLAALCGCSADTYTVNSRSANFKLKNVAGITLAGPGGDSADGTQVELSPGSAEYEAVVRLVQGKKQTECETESFGLCYLNFTFTTGDAVKVYPANDGSNWLCLYSLNPAVARYLLLPAEDMAELAALFETYEIQVNYS